MALRQTYAPEASSQIGVDSKWQFRGLRCLVDHARAIFKDYPDLLPAELATSLTAFMYCGAMICEPAVFDMMPAAPPFSLIADVLAPMVSQGLPLIGYVHAGFFRTVDHLADYEQLYKGLASADPRVR